MDSMTTLVVLAIAAIVYSATSSLLSARRHAAEVARIQKQIDALLRHQQKLVLMVKASSAGEADASLARFAMTEPKSEIPTAGLSVPAIAAETIRSVSDPVMIKDPQGRPHKIRFIGLDPQTEADARDRMVNGDDHDPDNNL